MRGHTCWAELQQTCGVNFGVVAVVIVQNETPATMHLVNCAIYHVYAVFS